jgi:hypothetical protein
MGEGFSIQWVLLGVLAAVALAALIVSRRRAAFGGPALDAHEKLERLNQTRQIRGDLESTMRELEQLAQRLGDDLDRRSAELTRLIAEADRRLAALKAAPARDATPAASPTIVVTTRPAPNRATAADGVVSPDELSQRVYQLADQGSAPLDIARNLNEQVGKVELILALRRRGPANHERSCD